MSRTLIAARRGGGLNLRSGGTFARSTEGSRLTGAPTDGSTSFLAFDGVDVRRIENRGLGDTLLMEGSRQNVLLRSREAADATDWLTFGVITMTAAYANGPDGTAKGDRANASSGSARYQGTSIASSVMTVWSRQVAGSGTRQVRQGTNGVNVATFGTTGTTWARQEVANPNTGAGQSTTVECEDLSGSGGTTAHAEDVIVDLAQLELGVFPSSPIRTTTAAVTRGADSLSYAVGQYPESVLTAGFRLTFAPICTSAEFATTAPAQGWALVCFNNNANTLLLSWTGANAQVYIQNAAGTHFLTNATWSRDQVLTFTVAPNGNVITLAGFTTGNGTYATPAAWSYASGTLYVGDRSDGLAKVFGRFGTTIEAL